ncbi:proline-rich protein 19, partial [Leptodactylus fuscus]|uniref:proline-rich protein 19 n=1 Tax=Leptodactylus fuscus TaxID=238119 RepID=UPI003F4F34D6
MSPDTFFLPLSQVMSDSLSHPGPAPSAAPNSGVSSLTGHLMKIPNTNKALRIQRRKTKKERNTSRFVSHTEVFKKRLLRGVLGRRGALGGMVCQTGLKDVFNPRPVFITENRLTQHQGIFNHKVKSIDVGRLVGQTAEVGPPNTGTAPCTVGSIRDTPQSQRSLSLELIPTTQSKTQDLLSHQKEPSPEIPEAAGKCQPCPQSRDRPPSEISTSPFSNDPAPILETAESLVAILHTLSLFPGRNLMNETQQALLKKMRCLRDTTPTPCATPAQRIPGYKTPGSSAKYEERR